LPAIVLQRLEIEPVLGLAGKPEPHAGPYDTCQDLGAGGCYGQLAIEQLRNGFLRNSKFLRQVGRPQILLGRELSYSLTGR
jgi:hypothetical protein